jgi:hypothetical protein
LGRLSPRLLRRLEVLEDKRERQKIADDFCNVFNHLIWVRRIPSQRPRAGRSGLESQPVLNYGTRGL